MSLLDNLRTGDWLDEQEFPPLPWLVPSIIPAGMAILAGPPKVGKSWATLGLALAVSSGSVALGRIHCGRPRPVLLLALEDGDRRLQDRCRKLLGSSGRIPAKFTYLTNVTPGVLLDTIAEWLETFAADGGEALVVLDTLGKVAPPPHPGESAYARDYRIGSALKQTVDRHPGAALVVVHHDRKAGSTDFVETVSGTHGLTGAADSILVLNRERNSEDGLLKITGRDVIENEYALRIVDGVAWTLAADSLDAAAELAVTQRAEFGVGDHMAQVVRFVSRRPEGTRARDLVDGLGLSDDVARKYLNRAAENDRIVKRDRGLYVPVTSVPTVPSGWEESGTRDTWDTATGDVA